MKSWLIIPYNPVAIAMLAPSPTGSPEGALRSGVIDLRSDPSEGAGLVTSWAL